MLRTLLLLSTIQYPVLSPKRFSSTMASPIVLPHDEIEDLWFGGMDLQPGKAPSFDCVKRWFMANETFDNSCKKYEPLVAKLVNLPFDELIALGNTPRESLTLILLLDQLARNYSRGTPYPFTICDPLSQKLAEHFVLTQNHDNLHPPYKKIWYYLPFEHSESLPLQELALVKFANAAWELREGEWREYHDFVKQGLDFSWRHYVIIAKYGRFPHRNWILGREDTEEEKKFLAEGGDTFSGM